MSPLTIVILHVAWLSVLLVLVVRWLFALQHESHATRVQHHLSLHWCVFFRFGFRLLDYATDRLDHMRARQVTFVLVMVLATVSVSTAATMVMHCMWHQTRRRADL